ncbi:MAG: ATP synthase F0 subunit B [Candidatus Binatia bacterium]
MKKHLNKVALLAVSLWLLAGPSMLWAVEEGHGEHEGGGSQLLVLAFFTINFLLFVLVLRRYALPVIRENLRQRRATVVQALNEAQRAREEAEGLRRDYEQKLASLAAEQERLYAQALEAAERERGRILEEAQRLAERVRAEAQQIAQREIEDARRSLRQEVAEQAVRIATDMIRSRLTPADQSRFVRDLVSGVQHAGNDSR